MGGEGVVKNPKFKYALNDFKNLFPMNSKYSEKWNVFLLVF